LVGGILVHHELEDGDALEEGFESGLADKRVKSLENFLLS